MSLFIKKIKCPKCKSTSYTKVDLEKESDHLNGAVMNPFDVGGRSRVGGGSAMVKGNMTEYFKCNDCGTIYPIERER